jgi:hypothetical protein
LHFWDPFHGWRKGGVNLASYFTLQVGRYLGNLRFIIIRQSFIYDLAVMRLVKELEEDESVKPPYMFGRAAFDGELVACEGRSAAHSGT